MFCVCVYCAIGQRADAVTRVIGALRYHRTMHKSIVMMAGDEQASGLAYSAPYAAMTIAEHFASDDRDVEM